MNKEKGFILVIVEGKSDQIVLEPILDSFFNRPDSSQKYRIEFLRGRDGAREVSDITTHGNVRSQSIFGLIKKFYIEPWLDNNHQSPERICKIIHIVDMDGAYIDDSHIEYDSSRMDPDNVWSEKPKYCKEKIISANTEQTKRRNAQKRNNIDWLSRNDTIHYNGVDEVTGENIRRDVDYEVYFFSCNLDHVLHGDANLSGWEKNRKAREFVECCEGDSEMFIEAIKPNILANMTYEESWDFITERNNNSLGPYTNINILLSR